MTFNVFSLIDAAHLVLVKKIDPRSYPEVNERVLHRLRARQSHPEYMVLEPVSLVLWVMGRALVAGGWVFAIWAAMAIYSQHAQSLHVKGLSEAFSAYVQAVGPDGLRSDLGNVVAMVAMGFIVLGAIWPGLVFNWTTPVDTMVQKRLIRSVVHKGRSA